MICQELSVLIRDGSISRDEALYRLQQEVAIFQYPEKAVSELGALCGMSKRQIDWAVLKAQGKVKLLKLALDAKYAFMKPPELPL
jgi:hypothetical protein